MVKTNIELIKWAEEITKLNADIERLDQEKTEAEDKLKQKLEQVKINAEVGDIKADIKAEEDPVENRLQEILDKQEEKIAEVKPVEIKSVELQVEEVKKLINEGKNYKEIAKMLNVEYNRLYYFINKNNLNPAKPKKKSKERKKTKNKDTGEIP